MMLQVGSGRLGITITLASPGECPQLPGRSSQLAEGAADVRQLGRGVAVSQVSPGNSVTG
jgi:hypothetical protein